MKNSFFFIYNENAGTREQIQDVLNRMNKVLIWRYDMLNVFYVTSNSNVFELSAEFESLNGKKGRYAFIEYNGKAQGRLTEESWYLLNNKELKPE